MLEHWNGDAERRQALADAPHRLDKDRLFQFLHGGAEPSLPGEAVGLDLAARRLRLGGKPRAVIAVHLDVADHGDDRSLADVDLGSGHLRDAMLEIGPAKAAMPYLVAHDVAQDLIGGPVRSDLDEVTENVKGDLLGGADQCGDDRFERRLWIERHLAHAVRGYRFLEIDEGWLLDIPAEVLSHKVASFGVARFFLGADGKEVAQIGLA